jgi:hypothetical protein
MDRKWLPYYCKGYPLRELWCGCAGGSGKAGERMTWIRNHERVSLRHINKDHGGIPEIAANDVSDINYLYFIVSLFIGLLNRYF